MLLPFEAAFEIITECGEDIAVFELHLLDFGEDIVIDVALECFVLTINYNDKTFEPSTVELIQGNDEVLCFLEGLLERIGFALEYLPLLPLKCQEHLIVL
jgi:hypothetical protein